MITVPQTIALSAFALYIAGSPLFAQSDSSTSTIAVLDVAKIFKNHAGFNRQLEDIKREIQSFEAEVNRQRQALADESESLQQYKTDSPQYKQIETAIAQRTSDLQVRLQLKRRELLEQEATLYYETYQQIVSAVARVAQQNRIDLVVRFDSDEIDPTDRVKILKKVNRFVVVQQKLDLTNMVLRLVNPVQAQHN